MKQPNYLHLVHTQWGAVPAIKATYLQTPVLPVFKIGNEMLDLRKIVAGVEHQIQLRTGIPWHLVRGK